MLIICQGENKNLTNITLMINILRGMHWHPRVPKVCIWFEIAFTHSMNLNRAFNE
jgi:hypothetical protein